MMIDSVIAVLVLYLWYPARQSNSNKWKCQNSHYTENTDIKLNNYVLIFDYSVDMNLFLLLVSSS